MKKNPKKAKKQNSRKRGQGASMVSQWLLCFIGSLWILLNIFTQCLSSFGNKAIPPDLLEKKNEHFTTLIHVSWNYFLWLLPYISQPGYIIRVRPHMYEWEVPPSCWNLWLRSQRSKSPLTSSDCDVAATSLPNLIYYHIICTVTLSVRNCDCN